MRGGRRQKAKALDVTMSAMNTYLFSLVSMGTGIEDWKLDQGEADALGGVMADCARALPSKKFKAVETLLGQVAPWIGLVGTAAVVLTPRIRAHRYIRAVQSGRIRLPNGAGNAERTVQGAGGTASDAGGDGHAAAASTAASSNGDAQGSGAAISGDAAGGASPGGQGIEILGLLD